MSAADTTTVIRAWSASHRLPATQLERWLLMDERDRFALLSLAQALHFRTGQLVAALELLEDLALRENESIADTLARDHLKRIIGGAGSAPGRARALLDALRAMRYPRLAGALSRLRAEIAALKLPRGATVLLPENLASDELKVELAARSGAELSRLIGALADRRAKLARIAELLGGNSEL